MKSSMAVCYAFLQVSILIPTTMNTRVVLPGYSGCKSVHILWLDTVLAAIAVYSST